MRGFECGFEKGLKGFERVRIGFELGSKRFEEG